MGLHNQNILSVKSTERGNKDVITRQNQNLIGNPRQSTVVQKEVTTTVKYHRAKERSDFQCFKQMNIE